MATLTTSLSAILALLSLLTSSSSAADSDVTVQTELTTSNNKFSCEIYRQVSAAVTPQTNVFLSPFCVLIGLGMVHAGAKGKTRSQLAEAMHLEKYRDNERDIGDAFRRLTSAVNSPSSNHTLRTANRLFAAEAGPRRVLESFHRFMENYFRAALMTLNFAKELDRSRRTINEWVSDNTENKIRNILPDGSVDSNTRMVMVNAVFFRGFWENSFRKEETKEHTFHLSRDDQTTVQMMTRPVTVFNYHESTELECQVLELPYVGKEVSMFVFLPRDIEGLSAIESQLTADFLAETFQSMDSANVKATMPKFGEDQGVQLKEFLEKMGMTDMFDENEADLSGIDGTKRLRVTEALHRAYIVVDEEGTEAAASTVVVIKSKSAGNVGDAPVVVFTADRPFLYAIVSKTTRCVLFLGRFVGPSRLGSVSGSGSGPAELGRTAEKRLGGGPNGAASNGPVAAGMLLGLGLLLLIALMRKQLV